MLKSMFVFLDLCYWIFDFVLMFKSGFVFLSLCFCVFEIMLLCSLNGFGVGFGLVSLKEMRFYGFVLMYFGACCVWCVVVVEACPSWLTKPCGYHAVSDMAKPILPLPQSRQYSWGALSLKSAFLLGSILFLTRRKLVCPLWGAKPARFCSQYQVWWYTHTCSMGL